MLRIRTLCCLMLACSASLLSACGTSTADEDEAKASGGSSQDLGASGSSGAATAAGLGGAGEGAAGSSGSAGTTSAAGTAGATTAGGSAEAAGAGALATAGASAGAAGAQRTAGGAGGAVGGDGGSSGTAGSAGSSGAAGEGGNAVAGAAGAAGDGAGNCLMPDPDYVLQSDPCFEVSDETCEGQSGPNRLRSFCFNYAYELIYEVQDRVGPCFAAIEDPCAEDVGTEALACLREARRGICPTEAALEACTTGYLDFLDNSYDGILMGCDDGSLSPEACASELSSFQSIGGYYSECMTSGGEYYDESLEVTCAERLEVCDEYN